MNPVELFYWALLGGLVGTVMMDVVGWIAGKLKIAWGGCGGSAAIGRWSLGVLHGQLVHENINESDTFQYEKAVGLICHYVIGGTLALSYPAVYFGFGIAMPGNNLIPCLIWGFVTALLPWLVLFPGFGWGLFGGRSPGNVRPLIAPAIEHSIYGLGLGIVLNMTSQLWQTI